MAPLGKILRVLGGDSQLFIELETGPLGDRLILESAEHVGQHSELPTILLSADPAAVHPILEKQDGKTFIVNLAVIGQDARSMEEVKKFLPFWLRANRFDSEDFTNALVFSIMKFLQDAKRIGARLLKYTESTELDELAIFVDPGDASAEEIAEYLIELSRLYKMLGGSGIQFARDEIREVLAV